ncbi:hypothetical protein SAMN05192585_15215, partial [Acetanaerobacterium elongatum]
PTPNPLPHFKAHIVQDSIMREGENCSGASPPNAYPLIFDALRRDVGGGVLAASLSTMDTGKPGVRRNVRNEGCRGDYQSSAVLPNAVKIPRPCGIPPPTPSRISRRILSKILLCGRGKTVRGLAPPNGYPPIFAAPASGCRGQRPRRPVVCNQIHVENAGARFARPRSYRRPVEYRGWPMAAPTNALLEGRRGELCSPAVISDFRLQATILCRNVGGFAPDAPHSATKCAIGKQGRLPSARGTNATPYNTAKRKTVPQK